MIYLLFHNLKPIPLANQGERGTQWRLGLPFFTSLPTFVFNVILQLRVGLHRAFIQREY